MECVPLRFDNLIFIRNFWSAEKRVQPDEFSGEVCEPPWLMQPRDLCLIMREVESFWRRVSDEGRRSALRECGSGASFNLDTARWPRLAAAQKETIVPIEIKSFFGLSFGKSRLRSDTMKTLCVSLCGGRRTGAYQVEQKDPRCGNSSWNPSCKTL